MKAFVFLTSRNVFQFITAVSPRLYRSCLGGWTEKCDLKSTDTKPVGGTTES